MNFSPTQKSYIHLLHLHFENGICPNEVHCTTAFPWGIIIQKTLNRLITISIFSLLSAK